MLNKYIDLAGLQSFDKILNDGIFIAECTKNTNEGEIIEKIYKFYYLEITADLKIKIHELYDPSLFNKFYNTLWVLENLYDSEFNSTFISSWNDFELNLETDDVNTSGTISYLLNQLKIHDMKLTIYDLVNTAKNGEIGLYKNTSNLILINNDKINEEIKVLKEIDVNTLSEEFESQYNNGEI